MAERSSSAASGSASGSTAGSASDETPRGFGAQFGRTKSALLGLVSAHFKLLSTELSEIMDQVKRLLALAAAAFALVFMAGILIFVGSILWLGEWVFGSMGWGLLHGALGLVGLAVILGLAIVPKSAGRIGLGFLVALLIALAVGLILWLQLSSRFFGWIGDGNLVGWFSGMTSPFDGKAVSAADRPIVVAAVIFAALFGIVGLLAGLFLGSGPIGRIGAALGLGILAGLLGAAFGALFGVPVSWGCSIAVALAVFFLAFPILAAIFVLPNADWDEMKTRFTPVQTIETTKETIEWVRAQMPLGRKS